MAEEIHGTLDSRIEVLQRGFENRNTMDILNICSGLIESCAALGARVADLEASRTRLSSIVEVQDSRIVELEKRCENLEMVETIEEHAHGKPVVERCTCTDHSLEVIFCPIHSTVQNVGF